MLTQNYVFLNITNHPSSEWPAVQQQAVLRLGGPVMDVPFPPVPPEASSAEVQALALQFTASLPYAQVSGALVQGEFLLTFLMVLLLERRGIPCFAATTRRSASSHRLSGSSVRKTSLFEFVQFRRYNLSI